MRSSPFLAPVALTLLAGCSILDPAPPPTAERTRAAAAALVSPVFELGDHPTGPDERQVFGGDIAYGAGEYLAVWQRNFDGSYFAARIATTGQLIDATPIPLDVASGFAGVASPLVAYDGTNFHAFWGGATAVRTTRLSPGGSPIGPMASFGATFPLDAACSSAGCVVLWEDPKLRATFVSADGVVSSNSATIASTASESRIVATPSGYLVAWVVNGGPNVQLWTQTLDATGVPSATAAREISSSNLLSSETQHIEAATSATNVLLTLRTTDVNNQAQYACETLRVGFDGTPLDLAPTSQSNTLGCWSVASNGTDFLVGDIVPVIAPLYAPTAVVTATVPADGGAAEAPVVQPEPLLSSTVVARNGVWGKLASDGTGYLLLTSDGGYYSVILATALDAAGRVTAGPTIVNRAPAFMTGASVAGGTNGFLAAWADDRAWPEPYSVYGTLVGLDGGVTARAVPIAQGAASFGEAPALAAASSGYMAAWLRGADAGTQVVGAMVTPAGDAGATFLLDFHDGGLTSESAPRLGSDGQDFAATWTDWDGVLHFAHVSPQGDRLDDGGVAIVQGLGSTLASAPIVWNGTSYVVAWTTSNDAVDVAWVAASGAILRGPVQVAKAASTSGMAALACAPSECVVGWGSAGSASLQRFDALGNLLGPAMKPIVSDVFAIDHIAWDGRAFVIVYRDTTEGLKAVWMATNGVIFDGPTPLVPPTAGPEGLAVSAGVDMIAYTSPNLSVISDGGQGQGGSAWIGAGTVSGVLFGPDVPEPTDAGLFVPEAGDAGSVPDASGVAGDGGASDASAAGDAGSTADAGSVGGGGSPDSGSPGGDASVGPGLQDASADGGDVAPSRAGGCGCKIVAAPAGEVPAFAAAVVALVAWRRLARRRRLRSRPSRVSVPVARHRLQGCPRRAGCARRGLNLGRRPRSPSDRSSGRGGEDGIRTHV